MSRNNPNGGVPVYNGLDPVLGDDKNPVSVAVDVTLTAGDAHAWAEIDLRTHVAQHKLRFVQGAFISAIGLAANGFVDLFVPSTRHRVRVATPSQVWTPLICTDDLRFIIRATPELAGATFRIHFVNFEVGYSAQAFASVPAI